ncbi:MAG: RcpC/CpaB family pilus assembly protein, partial [Bdellovibrionales bacterium]
LLAAVDIGTGIQQKKEIRTIMQDVLILATGLKVANELPRLLERTGNRDFIRNIRADTTFSNVTVEVDPREAQNLVYVLATNPSSLYFALRHPSDRGARVNLRPTTVESLRGEITSTALKRQVSNAPSVAPTPAPQPKKTQSPNKKRKNSGGFKTF